MDKQPKEEGGRKKQPTGKLPFSLPVLKKKNKPEAEGKAEKNQQAAGKKDKRRKKKKKRLGKIPCMKALLR